MTSMQNPTLTPLECDAALSDLILQAARAAIHAHVDSLLTLPDCGERNRPLMPLLVGLIDAAKTTAGAINDNAWDSGQAVPKDTAAGLLADLRECIQFVKTSTEAF
jgi:hypothetical protein